MLVAEQIQSLPDEDFLEEIRFKDFFSLEIIKDIEQGKKSLRWVLSRVHFQHLLEEIELREKSLKK